MNKANLIIIGLLFFMAVWPISIRSGFCYSQMKYLAPEELISPKGENGVPGTYCLISGEPWTLSEGDKWLNAFFGRMFYQVDCVSPRDQEEVTKWDTSYPYKSSWFSIPACGGRSVDSSGETIRKEDYDRFIKWHTEFWKKAKSD